MTEGGSGNVVTDTDASKILALTEALRAIMVEPIAPRRTHGERVETIAARVLTQVAPKVYTAALSERAGQMLSVTAR